MGISYTIDPETHIIYETAEGDISLQDFHEFRQHLRREELTVHLKFLADYRRAKVNLTFEEMLMIKNKNLEIIARYESAMLAIVAPDDLGRGMANMYRQINEEIRFKVATFRDYDEAERWLLEG